MRISYGVIEIDNYVILSSLHSFHFREYSIFVYRFGLKNAKPDIGKIFETNVILITKYLNCKKINFHLKMIGTE